MCGLDGVIQGLGFWDQGGGLGLLNGRYSKARHTSIWILTRRIARLYYVVT